jgi:hypothetical protein
MSDCGCAENPRVGPKPELSDDGEAKNSAYSPGEVRLYGRPGISVSDKESTEPKRARVVSSPKKSNNGEGRDEGEILKLVIRPSGVTARDIHGSDQSTLSISDSSAPSIESIGVIYGYSYEGHCYKFPKPQIMLLPVVSRPVVDGDCGYMAELGYAVWQVDKLERAVVLDVRTNDLKTLVLDANAPGNRSPLAYAQVMALAPHRSSRD